MDKIIIGQVIIGPIEYLDNFFKTINIVIKITCDYMYSITLTFVSLLSVYVLPVYRRDDY